MRASAGATNAAAAGRPRAAEPPPPARPPGSAGAVLDVACANDLSQRAGVLPHRLVDGGPAGHHVLGRGLDRHRDLRVRGGPRPGGGDRQHLLRDEAEQRVGEAALVDVVARGEARPATDEVQQGVLGVEVLQQRPGLLGVLGVRVDHARAAAGEADEALAVQAAARPHGGDQGPADHRVAVGHRVDAALRADHAAPEVVALQQDRDLALGELLEGAVAPVGAELQLLVAQTLVVDLLVEGEGVAGVGRVADPLAVGLVDDVLAGAVQQRQEALRGGGFAHGRAGVDLQRRHAGGSLALSCLAVVRTSSQLFGCHVPGRPARRKSCLLKYSTRPSVPTGTPYCLPPTWVMQAMALRIWAQPSQPSTTDHTTWSSGHPLLEVGDGEVRDPARLDVVLDAVSDLPEPTGRKPGNSPRLTTSPARQV